MELKSDLENGMHFTGFYVNAIKFPINDKWFFVAGDGVAT